LRTRVSPLGLNALNFFMAAAQTGFGPFLSVYLTVEKWDQTAIGFALSISTIAGIVTRLPAGALVDAIHAKRAPIAVALALLALSALVIALWPAVLPVWLALILHGFSSSILTPAIAAVTLSICGQNAFGERLGTNARYASLGSAAAAGLLGAAATFSERSVFLLTAAMFVPALLALRWVVPHQVDAQKDHPALLHPKQRKQRHGGPWRIFIGRHLHVFAICVVLFHLSNAAMLPLALNELAVRGGETGWVISASVIVPQVLVALLSPWTGRMAQSWGRRPLLLIGFAAVPLRALLFVSLPSGPWLVLFELLDGVSATVFGIMLPLIAADLTRRTGYLNLAIGSLGLAASIGATFSTTMAGWIADHFSPQAAFLALAAAGGAAVLMIWFDMPETRPSPRRLAPAHA
jgi:MFS family permease